MMSLEHVNRTYNPFSNEAEYIGLQSILLPLIKAQLLDSKIVKIVNEYLLEEPIIVDMTIFLQYRDIVQIIEQCLWEPTLYINESMLQALTPYKASSNLCIDLTQRSCPIAYRDFSDLAWEKFIKHHYYFLALIQDNTSTCICDAEQFNEWVATSGKFINPLTQEAIKAVHYFMTESQPVFSFISTCYSVIDIENRVKDTILADSLISSRNRASARLTLLQKPEVQANQKEYLRLLLLCVTDHPEVAIFQSFLAIELRKQGNLKSAKVHFEKVITLHPKDITARSNLAIITAQLNEMESAKTHCEEWITLDPMNSEPYRAYGSILFTFKQFEQAKISLEKAIALNKTADHHSYGALGLVLEALQELNQAKACFEKVIELAPENPAGYIWLCNVLLGLNQFETAKSYFDKIVTLDLEDRVNIENFGNILRGLKQFETAKIYLEKAIALDPESAFAHAQLGDVLRELKQFKRAAMHLEKAVQLDPKSAIIHGFLGILLQELKQPEKAKMHLEKAIELDPKSAFTLNHITKILQKIKI